MGVSRYRRRLPNYRGCGRTWPTPVAGPGSGSPDPSRRSGRTASSTAALQPWAAGSARSSRCAPPGPAGCPPPPFRPAAPGRARQPADGGVVKQVKGLRGYGGLGPFGAIRIHRGVVEQVQGWLECSCAVAEGRCCAATPSCLHRRWRAHRLGRKPDRGGRRGVSSRRPLTRSRLSRRDSPSILFRGHRDRSRFSGSSRCLLGTDPGGLTVGPGGHHQPVEGLHAPAAIHELHRPASPTAPDGWGVHPTGRNSPGFQRFPGQSGSARSD